MDLNNLKCLGVIIPTFNEENTVQTLIEKVLEQSYIEEVIIVDDGSTDNTLEIVRSVAAKNTRLLVLAHDQNRGKGAAIKTGLKCASSPILVIQDADLEYEPSDLQAMLQLILSGEADVVYGSRFSSSANNKTPWWHFAGNKLLTAISNKASGLNLSDEATCYKMFRKSIICQVQLNEDRFGFCPEITAKIAKMGVKIREVPIRYKGRSKAEGKKINFLDGISAVYCIVRYNYFI